MTDDDALTQTRTALQNLPMRLRRILVLCEVEGLAMGEAAMRLGLSREAAERRWARAVVALSERLETLGAACAPAHPANRPPPSCTFPFG
jgi:DNA-directed RNA polymerase specialized sigma24 family protein